jgi:hypothetical protein
VCEAPRHLLLTTEPGTQDEGQIEVWLTDEGARTRLVVEERGLPLTHLPFHASGWRAHLEDLGRSLELGGPVHPDGWGSDAGAPGWKRRWEELTPTYQQAEIH